MIIEKKAHLLSDEAETAPVCYNAEQNAGHLATMYK
jgi:hypothetical protein